MNPAPAASMDGFRAGDPTRHTRTIASGGIDELEATARESVL
ncbi:hypothetical protein [Streptomyces sp. ML-6]|nr:hypothetical protein [Streptomyces sp. ML-6]MDK0519474.1 hypothetical protein [Streptomyces sp. ML-6]